MNNSQRIQDLERRLQLAEEARQHAEERLEQERQLAEEARQHAEEQLEQERQRAEQERQRAEQQLEETNSLRLGTYYSSIDQVWESIAAEYSINHWEALRRSHSPQAIACHYVTTVDQANLDGNIPRCSQTRHSRSSAPSNFWPVDIFGNEDTGDIAHLLPAGSTNASLYDDVAAWTLALPAYTPDLSCKNVFTGV
jgi:hypothetical protein